MLRLLVLALVCGYVNADCHLHNNRGSNNRLDGRGRNVRNNRRLFDSQNNNRAGYNAGPKMLYYADSTLQIEWTNQHSCGRENSNCDLILQYMCDNLIRDGTKTDTIPTKSEEIHRVHRNQKRKCIVEGCNEDFTFGMHEDSDYYDTCQFTKQDDNLYHGDRNVRMKSSQYTRQNNNGQRRGFECPEERDYYPYWRPTPWKDIAIITNNITRCSHFKTESQNVKSRFYCKPPAGYLHSLVVKLGKTRRKHNEDFIPIREAECTNRKFSFEVNGTKVEGNGVWTEVKPHGIAPPDCKSAESVKSRDNHLGNGVDGFVNHYIMKVPNIGFQSSCVLRIRYNMSTVDYDYNADGFDNTVRGRMGANVAQHLGIDEEDARVRGYVLKTNPTVRPMAHLEKGQDVTGKFKLKLAFNMAQFGRTFEDRSHTFSILPRPKGIDPTKKIINVNVNGKRGNIVQTYPATEYDFVPNKVEVTVNDEYLHFQWTGSDNNPGNNAGQGRAGTDRSNVCLMKDGDTTTPNTTPFGTYSGSFPDTKVLEKNRVLIFGENVISVEKLCTSGGGSEELDQVGAKYDHGLIQCKAPGTYYYLCTRNNNFTNRSQKAMIICKKAKK